MMRHCQNTRFFMALSALEKLPVHPAVAIPIAAIPVIWMLDPLHWKVITVLKIVGVLAVGLLGAFLALRKPATSADNVRAKRFANTLIGHRGCRYVVSSAGFLIPENSMWAFTHAADNGVDGVELDTRLTKDGVPVVIHDGTAQRLMEGSCAGLAVADLTLAELRQQLKWKKLPPHQLSPKKNIAAGEEEKVGADGFGVLSARDQELFEHPIPTLEDVMQLCSRCGIKLMIEVKENGRMKEMAAAIRDLYRKFPNAHDWAFVASFNPYFIWCVREADPAIETMILYRKNMLYETAKSGAERWPWWVDALTPIWDPLLTWACEGILIKFLGVGMVGVHNVLVSKHMIDTYMAQGVVTDVWVCNQPSELTWLQRQGAICTTDFLFDEYNQSRGGPARSSDAGGSSRS